MKTWASRTNESFKAGKGKDEVQLGHISQKHKEKGVSEFLHEDKLKEKDLATTSRSSSSGSEMHHGGKH
jgi:hypothetical protein